MARYLTNQHTESTGGYPVQFVVVQPDDNDTNTLYLNTSYRKLELYHNGSTKITYPAAGILNLTAVEETKDVKTNQITVELNGIPNTIIPVLKRYDGIGGIVTIYQGWMDDTNQDLDETSPVKGVYIKWKGVIQSHSVDEENQNFGEIKVRLECKNILSTILGSKHGRFTSDSSFKRTSNNDRSMEFVAAMATFNPKFGKEN
jgi:ribulose-5-phosphate 4-epimerase/fuculose-1-phosphate aldolase